MLNGRPVGLSLHKCQSGQVLNGELVRAVAEQVPVWALSDSRPRLKGGGI